MPSLSIIVRQRIGTFSLGLNEHSGNLDILGRQVKLVLSIRANSTCSPEEGEQEHDARDHPLNRRTLNAER